MGNPPRTPHIGRDEILGGLIEPGEEAVARQLTDALLAEPAADIARAFVRQHRMQEPHVPHNRMSAQIDAQANERDRHQTTRAILRTTGRFASE